MDNERTRNESCELTEPDFVEGELVAEKVYIDTEIEEQTKIAPLKKSEVDFSKVDNQNAEQTNSVFYFQYVFLPLIFLTVALLGGLRVGAKENGLIFLKPPLTCLIFAAILIVLFFRAKLINLEGWFKENFTTLKNISNGLVLTTLFAASTQVFNSLIPESGLPFWIIAFCFFWTLWNNLFAEFNTKKLLQSLGGLFGLAFVVKYLVLANLSSSKEGSWITRIWENPAQEAFTYFLDIPSFSPATGYIQFFTLVFFLIALFLVKPAIPSAKVKT